MKQSTSSFLLYVLLLALFQAFFIPSMLIAQGKKTRLKIATYESFVSNWGPGPKLKAAFEQQCQCEVIFQTAPGSVSLFNRFKHKANLFNVDILLGLDDSLIAEALATKQFVPHKLKLPSLALSQPWQDAVFIPIDRGYFAFIYKPSKLKKPPTSMAELLQRDDLKIAYQDPRTSLTGRGLLLWFKRLYGEETPQAWRQLIKKTQTVTSNWAESYALFLEGEVDMVLSYQSSPAYHKIVEKNNDFAAALFSEGHYRQIEVAAIHTKSTEPELARQFLLFLLSAPAQRIIALNNWMYPVIDLKVEPALDQLPMPKVLEAIDSHTVAQHKQAWIAEWLMNNTH